MVIRRRCWVLPLIGLLLTVPLEAGAFDVFRYEEATIADIHAAFKARTLTCRRWSRCTSSASRPTTGRAPR
jgi:hypothetical protein